MRTRSNGKTWAAPTRWLRFFIASMAVSRISATSGASFASRFDSNGDSNTARPSFSNTFESGIPAFTSLADLNRRLLRAFPAQTERLFWRHTRHAPQSPQTRFARLPEHHRERIR